MPYSAVQCSTVQYGTLLCSAARNVPCDQLSAGEVFSRKTGGCPDKEGNLGTGYCTDPIENASIRKCIIALHALASKIKCGF